MRWILLPIVVLCFWGSITLQNSVNQAAPSADAIARGLTYGAIQDEETAQQALDLAPAGERAERAAAAANAYAFAGFLNIGGWVALAIFVVTQFRRKTKAPPLSRGG